MNAKPKPAYLRHAVVLLASFVIACGGDDSDKKKSAAQMDWGDGGSSQLDLSGLWVSNDFACGAARLREFVKIEQYERDVTGVKVTGDECVPAGYVSFEGKLPRAGLTYLDLPVRFPVRGYSGEQGRPGTIAVTATGEALVTAPDVVQLVFSNVSVRLTRSDEDPSAPTSAEPTAGSGSTRSRTPTVERDAGAPDEEPADSDAGSRAGRSTTRRAARPDAAVSDSDAAAETADAAAETPDAEVEPDARDAAVGDAAPPAPGDCPNPILPGASCDQVAQCGCAEGENCRFDELEPPSCFPAGPIGERGGCSMASDCAAGSTCAYGLCMRMCNSEANCDRGSCEQASLDRVDVEGLGLCVEQCDPVVPDLCYDRPTPATSMCQPCGSNRTCLPMPEHGLALCVLTDEQLEPGAACTTDRRCFGGHCDNGTCKRWCRSNNDCVGTGETCDLTQGVTVNQGDNIGHCTGATMSSL